MDNPILSVSISSVKNVKPTNLVLDKERIEMASLRLISLTQVAFWKMLNGYFEVLKPLDEQLKDFFR